MFSGEYQSHDGDRIDLLGSSRQTYRVQGEIDEAPLEEYRFSVRTDHIFISHRVDQLTNDNVVNCEVVDSEFHGSYVKLNLQVLDEDTRFNAHIADHVFQTEKVQPGDRIWAGWDRQHTWLLHVT